MLPTQFAGLQNHFTDALKTVYSSQLKLCWILSCGSDEIFRTPFFSSPSFMKGAFGHTCPLLTTVATAFQFRTKAFLHMNYFYWRLDYDAQKSLLLRSVPQVIVLFVLNMNTSHFQFVLLTGYWIVRVPAPKVNFGNC